MRNSVDRWSKWENKSKKKKTGILSNSPFCEGKRPDFEPRWLGLKLCLSHLSLCGVWQLNEPANGMLIGQMEWKILIAYSWWNRNIWWGQFLACCLSSVNGSWISTWSSKTSVWREALNSNHLSQKKKKTLIKKSVFICSKVNNREKNILFWWRMSSVEENLSSINKIIGTTPETATHTCRISNLYVYTFICFAVLEIENRDLHCLSPNYIPVLDEIGSGYVAQPSLELTIGLPLHMTDVCHYAWLRGSYF